MKPLSSLAWLVVLIALVLGLWWWRSSRTTGQLLTGDPVPRISAPNHDGRPFDLQALQGAYVLIDFWGSWCVPCRREHPELVRLIRDVQMQLEPTMKRLEVVGIAVKDRPQAWRSAIEKDSLYWPHHVLDTIGIADRFGVVSVPTKFLVNEKGVIVLADPSLRELERYLYRQLVPE